MAGVKVHHVTKSFGDTNVLKGISLDIADGEFVSLVGPSGCGKSTLLRIIAGLEHQTSGDVLIGGRSVAGVRAADRNLSMVFQSYALYPHLSVAENIAVPLRMRELSGWQRLPLVGGLMPGARLRNSAIRDAVLEAARTLEIDGLLSRKPGQLSGGQRQRVALGRALVRQPAAFLLDEPLSNLDAKLRVQTRSEIAQLHRRLQSTFIYVTHDQVEAMTMSSRIAVMMGGEILQCAAPDIVYDDPDDIHVAEFIGSPKINVLPAVIDAGSIRVLGREIGVAVSTRGGGDVRIGLRPEAVKLGPPDEWLSGTVEHTENLGADVFAQVAVPALSSRIVLRTDAADRHRVTLGAVVGLSFDPAAALVFDSHGKRMRDVSAVPIREQRVA